MTPAEQEALAKKIAAALRTSLSRPGYGYIDFTYHVSPRDGSVDPRDEEELTALADEIAEFWPEE